MKLNLFGSGKKKETKKPTVSKTASTRISELEEKLNGWTDNLKKTEQKLKNISSDDSLLTKQNDTSIPEEDNAPTRPHGPISELSLDQEGIFAEDGSEDDPPNEQIEVVKMVEVQAEGSSSKAGEKGGQNALSGDSLKQLFTDNEDDENPLASLIQSLPEVTIGELEDDLKEIKDIIKDWQRK
jgi:hypothetical protein